MAPDPNASSSSTVLSKELKRKKDDKKGEDLSNEDLALKQQLESYVERAQDPDPGLQKVALESMRDGAKLKVGEGLVAAKLMDNRTGVVRRCKAMEMVRIGNLKF